jgi:hypothetical protein
VEVRARNGYESAAKVLNEIGDLLGGWRRSTAGQGS